MSEAREKAEAHIDKLLESGVITASEAAEKKERIEAKFNADRFEKERQIFVMQQSAAGASILLDAATAAARAFKDYPFPGSVLVSALAGAAAMAQLAAVYSAPAPKMHRGGMAPDERQITALSGEAVLDRRTVRGLGGERGIRRLQAGGAEDRIVVVQPFKHFDRFVKSSQRRGILATPKNASGAGGY